MKHNFPKAPKGCTTMYGLHEVFYQGKTKSWTEEPLNGFFTSKKELIATLSLMLKDAKKKRPILTYR